MYNVTVMDQSRLDAGQLQQRNPAAWTDLLHQELELADMVVTAVSVSFVSMVIRPSLMIKRWGGVSGVPDWLAVAATVGVP